jgi:hypothetical protein
LEVLNEKVAVTKSCPSGAVLLVNRDELDVVLNCCLVLTVGSAVLCKLVDAVNIHKVISLASCEISVDTWVGDWLRLNVLLDLRVLKLLADFWNIVLVVLRVLEAMLLRLVLVLLLLLVFLRSAHVLALVLVVLLLLLVAEFVQLLEEELGLQLIVGVTHVGLRTGRTSVHVVLRLAHVKLVVELGLVVRPHLVLLLTAVIVLLVLVVVELLHELHLVDIGVGVDRGLHRVLSLVLVHRWLLHLVVGGPLHLLLVGEVLQVWVRKRLVELLRGSLWLGRNAS